MNYSIFLSLLIAATLFPSGNARCAPRKKPTLYKENSDAISTPTSPVVLQPSSSTATYTEKINPIPQAANANPAKPTDAVKLAPVNKVTTKSPAPDFPAASGIATYHPYEASTSLLTVACSDGANGIITRWGHKTAGDMANMVTAYSGATWNSPACGTCFKVTGSAGIAFVTVIDQCASLNGYAEHFDLSPNAFTAACGNLGLGTCNIQFETATASDCAGNRG